MDVFSKQDNPDFVDWIYALSAEIAKSVENTGRDDNKKGRE
jgi:hypothetical protein